MIDNFSGIDTEEMGGGGGTGDIVVFAIEGMQ